MAFTQKELKSQIENVVNLQHKLISKISNADPKSGEAFINEDVSNAKNTVNVHIKGYETVRKAFDKDELDKAVAYRNEMVMVLLDQLKAEQKSLHKQLEIVARFK